MSTCSTDRNSEYHYPRVIDVSEPGSADFAPTASLEMLRRRAELLIRLREFFREHGYWEVQTPLLSRDSCVDAWIEPFAVPVAPEKTAYLQTSPEFALKRLMCSGADRVFEVTRSFRREEQGTLHNAEFTIVEWYARDEDHHQQMTFVEELVLRLAEFASRMAWTVSERTGPALFSKVSYEEAFRKVLNLSPANASQEELLSAARSCGGGVPRGLESDRDGLLNLLLAERVEPWLKTLQGAFLYDYPPSQAALAKISKGPAPAAERFELYLEGIEICNGYHELTDADELQTRMRKQNEKRLAAGKPGLPVESRLLQAMQHGLPECSGVALGFDRLAMWCLGCSAIQDVIAFPFDRA